MPVPAFEQHADVIHRAYTAFDGPDTVLIMELVEFFAEIWDNLCRISTFGFTRVLGLTCL
jgi:hypothetical protein